MASIEKIQPETASLSEHGTEANKNADASKKLSTETNHIGMTGITGSVERAAITTVDGILHIPQGLYYATIDNAKHPEEFIKTVAESAAVGAFLKVALPEAGPVGKVATILMGSAFVVQSLPGFSDAYSTGQNAKTWSELNHSGQEFGYTTGQLGVSAVAGTIGYKIGAGVTGRVLAAEGLDGFADAKQEFWNNRTDEAKRVLRMDTSVPTASSVGLMPNFALDGDKITLLDSTRESPPSDIVGSVPNNAEINTTIMLKSKASVLRMDRYINRMSRGKAEVLTDDENAFAERFGSSKESLDAVSKFAADHNLTVAESDLRSGRVLLTGKAADFQKAFSIKLNEYANETGTHSGHEGPVSLPRELAPHVRAVLGTDETPVVAASNRPVYRMADDAPPADPHPTDTGDKTSSGAPAQPVAETPENFIKRGGYLATAIARAQNFPLTSGGEGQSGAFVSLSGGVDLADYNKFFPDHGLEQPRPLGVLTVDGAINSPASPGGGVVEDLLDATQMQSIAPKAQIDMIVGPNNDQGLVDVFERGIFPRKGEAQKSVIGTSWGLRENMQTTQAINTLGITFRHGVIRGVQIFAGAGDNGARANGDAFQPEYPASDPNVTGVGGLKMILGADGKLTSATAWDEGEHSSTGGGISKIFKMPFWQQSLGNIFKNLDTGMPGRGVPDISTNAAKATGFPVRVNGENVVIGGTSAGSPFYAGLMLNINAELAMLNIKPVTPLNPWMYSRFQTPIFNDVDKGGNHGYEAGKGWDPVTGLGWVDGQQMLDAMKVNQTIQTGNVIPFIPTGLSGKFRTQKSDILDGVAARTSGPEAAAQNR